MITQPISLKWIVYPIKIEGLLIFNFIVCYHNKQNVKMWAETDKEWELIYDNNF